MLDDIVNALHTEMHEFLQTLPDGGGQVVLMTDFLEGKEITAVMPLVLLEVIPGEDSSQYGGGLTKMYYMIAFNSYHYMPDAYGDELATGYSTGLLKVIDMIRQHLSNEQWLTAGMTNILNNYGYRFTLSGISQASEIPKDGLKIGHRIHMNSVSFDPVTLQWKPGQALAQGDLQPSAVPPV